MSYRDFQAGSLVRARNREWVVLPTGEDDIIMLRPLGGSDEEITAIYVPLGFPEDKIEPVDFPYPQENDLASFDSAKLLYNATRLSFRSGAGPFRCFGKLSFRPRSYQIVPLIMALRQPCIRLLIADDVGIGKTIEAGLIVRELIDRGDLRQFTVLCQPHLCEQWQEELKNKFGIEAVIIRSGTVSGLEKHLPGDSTVYRYYPYQVISIDYVKSDQHYNQFVNECHDFVVVDEVHTCANTIGNQHVSQQQRHKLLKALSSRTTRHMVYLTATPHSGKQNEFQSILSLLKPEFGAIDFDFSEKESIKEVAEYFIQRKRKEIIKYLNEETTFPDREAREVDYPLSARYREFFNKVVAFTKEIIKPDGVTESQRRFRYWAALGLLRGVMSSPYTGMAMLRNRAFTADEDAAAQLYDEKEENPILDNDYSGDKDVAPTEVMDQNDFKASEVSKLKALSEELAQLADLKYDYKAKAAIDTIKEWLKEEYHPVVFCRYIETAKYFGEICRNEFSGSHKDLNIEIITGEIHDELRKEIIESMKNSQRRLLIATDCLSEGINLQESFNAVLHYDLPWNPNRLEQREGRIDRFGQESPTVKTYLLYSKNSPIDGVVLDVLIRKAREIREQIGISVPFPEDSKSILDAVLQAVFLNPKYGKKDIDQFQFDFLDDPAVFRYQSVVTDAYEKAKIKQEHIRNQFAHFSLVRSVDIEEDLKQTDLILGDPTAVKDFVIHAVRFLGGQIDQYRKGYKLFVGNLPAMFHSLFGDKAETLISFDSPTPEGYRYIGRNHVFVEQLCHYTLRNAYEGKGRHKVARASVFRSKEAESKTVIVLLRVRNVIARKNKLGEMVAEEVIFWGYRNDINDKDFLSSDEAVNWLRTASAGEDISDVQQENFLEAEKQSLLANQEILNQIARDRSSHLVDSHERYRKALGSERYEVGTVIPPDVLGIYIIFPEVNRN